MTLNLDHDLKPKTIGPHTVLVDRLRPVRTRNARTFLAYDGSGARPPFTLIPRWQFQQPVSKDRWPSLRSAVTDVQAVCEAIPALRERLLDVSTIDHTAMGILRPYNGFALPAVPASKKKADGRNIPELLTLARSAVESIFAIAESGHAVVGIRWGHMQWGHNDKILFTDTDLFSEEGAYGHPNTPYSSGAPELYGSTWHSPRVYAGATDLFSLGVELAKYLPIDELGLPPTRGLFRQSGGRQVLRASQPEPVGVFSGWHLRRCVPPLYPEPLREHVRVLVNFIIECTRENPEKRPKTQARALALLEAPR